MKKFPLWDVVEIAPANRWSATEVRNMLLDETCRPIPDPTWAVSDNHFDVVTKPLVDGKLDGVMDEFKIIQEYKKSWEKSPYPVAFQTVDAIVTQSGHILLVQRKAAPGKGLWALPGGYIQMTEKLVDAMLRELDEETKIKVPKAVLAGSIVRAETYDDPYRSVRGRTITRAYHIKLADQEKLPKIKGSDDARDAKWFQLSEFMKMRNQLFEDHFDLVCHMLGL
jgi:bifunctional NMN adenylyltransferase/nudix hydrolase